jgi:hypothetical protein
MSPEMTPLDLIDKLLYWQQILRLQAWDIQAVFIDEPHEFEGGDAPGAVGRICWGNPAYRTATIQILRPDHPIHTNGGPLTAFRRRFDAEQTLVHELLHLYWMRDSDEDDAREMAVDTLAWALVELDRKDRE